MNSLIHRPLTHWPELVAAFIWDLQQCQSHAAAAAFFEPLSPEEKSYLWEQCPQPLRRHLQQLKQAQQAQGAA